MDSNTAHFGVAPTLCGRVVLCDTCKSAAGDVLCVPIDGLNCPADQTLGFPSKKLTSKACVNNDGDHCKSKVDKGADARSTSSYTKKASRSR